MPSITSLLSRASRRLDGAWYLAVVPAVVALLSVEKFRQLPTADFHAGVSFAFPIPVSTAWNFLSLPSSGIEVTVAFDDPVLAVGSVLLSALVTAVLAAGYLGSIDRALSHRRTAFEADVRRYVRPLLGFQAVVAASALTAFGLAAVVPATLFLTVPLLLLGASLLYPAPYLVVVEGIGILDGFERAYGFTRNGGATLSYFVQYLLAAAGVSVPATLLFVNLGLPGYVLACLALAPVALVFDAATMAFVRDLTDGGEGGAADGPTPAVTRIET